MINDIPKFHETFIPILDVLSMVDVVHYREMQKQVVEKHYSHLPEELIKIKTKN